VASYQVDATETGLHFEIPVDQLDRATFEVSNPEPIRNIYSYDFLLPFASRLWIKSPDGRDHVLINVASPVTATTSRIFVTMLRNYDHDQPIADAVRFEQAVAAEDRPMVEDQRPEQLPLDLAEEVHIFADRFAIEYRKLLVKKGLSVAATG
jgi:vanillate O-demethylase monooxygenase subunit